MPQRKGLLQEVVFYFFNFLVMASFVWEPFLAGTCVAYKSKPFFEVGALMLPAMSPRTSTYVSGFRIRERSPSCGR